MECVWSALLTIYPIKHVKINSSLISYSSVIHNIFIVESKIYLSYKLKITVDINGKY